MTSDHGRWPKTGSEGRLTRASHGFSSKVEFRALSAAAAGVLSAKKAGLLGHLGNLRRHAGRRVDCHRCKMAPTGRSVMTHVRRWVGAAALIGTIMLPTIAIPETCLSPYIKGLRQPEKAMYLWTLPANGEGSDFLSV